MTHGIVNHIQPFIVELGKVTKISNVPALQPSNSTSENLFSIILTERYMLVYLTALFAMAKEKKI